MSDRRLRVELLEDRRMLAIAMVDTHLDVVDLNDGKTSLREAIFATNTLVGPDTIEFDPTLAGKTILLEHGELEITDALTINGLGQELLTINAQQNSRIFNITAASGDYTVTGLTLTGGRTTGPSSDSTSIVALNSGGAIRSLTSDELSIDRVTINGNRTEGLSADGGGIFVYEGSLKVISSTISGNSTLGAGAYGGGIHVDRGTFTMLSSTISENSTYGIRGRGGGAFLNVYSGTITNSFFIQNHTGLLPKK